MVNSQVNTRGIFLGVLRQQAQGRNVHRHHEIRCETLLSPVGCGVALIGLRDARIRQQVGGLAQVPQGPAQGGGRADGVPVRAHMGQQQHPVHGLQQGCGLLNGHLISSGSTMFSFSGLAGFTWFSMSRMCAP